jgi:hypothetical protein
MTSVAVKTTKYVSSRRPCKVCGGIDGCSYLDDGLLICRRRQGNQPGFRCLGRSKNNPEWTLYRRADDPNTASARTPPMRQSTFFSRPETPATDDAQNFPLLAKELAGNLTVELKERLAKSLGLPVEALKALPLIGWCPRQRCYTFPEVDPTGKVVGILLRWPSGRKRVMAGGKRGLTIPVGWEFAPGPVRVVEGPTDVLALAWIGRPVIGRPSSMAGGSQLIALLNGFDVVVVGENDEKPDGSWPGKNGAEFICKRLREGGIQAEVRMPPDGFKDAREWVVQRLRCQGV